MKILVLLFILFLSLSSFGVANQKETKIINCTIAYNETVKVFWQQSPEKAKEFALTNYPECIGG